MQVDIYSLADERLSKIVESSPHLTMTKSLGASAYMTLIIEARVTCNRKCTGKECRLYLVPENVD